jgi:hypothetical protein
LSENNEGNDLDTRQGNNHATVEEREKRGIGIGVQGEPKERRK